MSEFWVHFKQSYSQYDCNRLANEIEFKGGAVPPQVEATRHHNGYCIRVIGSLELLEWVRHQEWCGSVSVI